MSAFVLVFIYAIEECLCLLWCSTGLPINIILSLLVVAAFVFGVSFLVLHRNLGKHKAGELTTTCASKKRTVQQCHKAMFWQTVSHTYYMKFYVLNVIDLLTLHCDIKLSLFFLPFFLFSEMPVECRGQCKKHICEYFFQLYWALYNIWSYDLIIYFRAWWFWFFFF